MPCLDAKALETDPDGMAFLLSVLRPEGETDRPTGAKSERVVTPATAAFELARSRALIRSSEPTAATLPVTA